MTTPCDHPELRLIDGHQFRSSTQCFRCGRPVHVERLEPNRTFTTDPDGTPHTCQRDEDA